MLLVFTTSVIGCKISERKKFVKNFFERLKIFNGEEIADIGLFSKTIGEKLKALDNSTDKAIKGYEVIFDGKDFVCKDTRFNKEQREFISFYVNSLGRYDAAGQAEFQRGADKKIDILLAASSEVSKRYSALSIKLSFCLGLSAFIIMI